MKTITTDSVNNFLRQYPAGLHFLSVPFSIVPEKLSHLQDQQSLNAGQVELTRHGDNLVLRCDNAGALKYLFDQKIQKLLGNNIAYHYQLPLPEIQAWRIGKFDRLEIEPLPKMAELEVFETKLATLFNLNIEFELCKKILAGDYLALRAAERKPKKVVPKELDNTDDLVQTNIGPELVTSKTWRDSPVQMVPVTSLKYFPGNSHIYNDTLDTADLETSLDVFGIINPLIINDRNEVLAGNRRLHAAKQRGFLTVPVRIVNGIENELDFVLHSNIARKKTYTMLAKEASMYKKMGEQLRKKYNTFELRKHYPYGRTTKKHWEGKRVAKNKGWETILFVSALVNIRPTSLKNLLSIYNNDPKILAKMDANEWSIDKGYKEMRRGTKKGIEERSTYTKKKMFCKCCRNTYWIKVPIEETFNFGETATEATPKVRKTNLDSDTQYTTEEYFNTAQNKEIISDITARLSGIDATEERLPETNAIETAIQEINNGEITNT